MIFFTKLWNEWHSLSAVQALKPDELEICFYSEGKQDWPFLGSMALELCQRGKKILYLSSEQEDPAFQIQDSNWQSFYIGSGSVRTILFKTMRAKVVIMTLPELDCYALKRSPHNTHYVYVFHALQSTHMVYRPNAFDHYDTVFCAGPHQMHEIQWYENKYNLKKKNLIPHGYARLEALLETPQNKKTESQKKIVLAPSWGPCSILERPICETLIETLLKSDFEVTLRVHPMSLRHSLKKIHKIENLFSKNLKFKIEKDINDKKSIQEADLMISDWSGAAQDFALSRERPVLFINTPMKVQNSNYKDCPLIPFEVQIRNEVGISVEENEIHTAPEKIHFLCSNLENFAQKIREFRTKNVYNLGQSSKVGAENILKILDQIQPLKKEIQK